MRTRPRPVEPVGSMRLEMPTPAGLAWADVSDPAPTGTHGRDSAWALLVLGHGAGGSVDAPDLTAVAAAAAAAGMAVARVTQPYRVAGRRAPAAAPRLDEAWAAVLQALTARPQWRNLPVIHGGRSSGARVACRCARSTGAAAILALAFPTHPPGRPDRSREDELRAVACPLLVVQGERDAFGRPGSELFDGRERTLVIVPGADHSLKHGVAVTAAAVVDFCDQFRAR